MSTPTGEPTSDEAAALRSAIEAARAEVERTSTALDAVDKSLEQARERRGLLPALMARVTDLLEFAKLRDERTQLDAHSSRSYRFSVAATPKHCARPLGSYLSACAQLASLLEQRESAELDAIAAEELALKARRTAAKARQGAAISASSRASQAQRQVQEADAGEVAELLSRYATLHQVLKEVTD
jgi:hypothetical protein